MSDADGEVNLTTGAALLTVTEIDASGSLGTLVLDTSTIAAAIDAVFGAGTNTITTEVGLADTLELAASAGTDTINVQSDNGGTSAADTIVNFEAGNDGDVVSLTVAELDGTGADVVNGSGVDLSASLAVIFQTDDDGTFTLGATTTIVVLTNTFASSAAVDTALSGGVTTASTVIADDDNILVLWTDGASSYLSRFQVDDADPDAGTIADFDVVEDLIVFQGVAVTDLTADNFSFV